jgi:hypothetical protein
MLCQEEGVMREIHIERVLCVLLLSACACGCWDGERFVRGSAGPAPFRQDSLWSFALTRHVGAPLLESDANLVPGMDIFCVFGFLGCLLLDAAVFPVALIHDIVVIARGARSVPWRGRERGRVDEAEWYRSPSGLGP